MKTLTRALAGVAATTVLAVSVPQTTIAQQLTITSWGGSYSMSQRKAYYEPFMKETGLTILEDEWDGSIALIRAMVETGNYKRATSSTARSRWRWPAATKGSSSPSTGTRSA